MKNVDSRNTQNAKIPAYQDEHEMYCQDLDVLSQYRMCFLNTVFPSDYHPVVLANGTFRHTHVLGFQDSGTITRSAQVHQSPVVR